MRDVDLQYRAGLDLSTDLAHKYHVTSLAPLLQSARTVIDTGELSIAVIGRFKAGKSSFLNCFFGRDLLPVGVVPVTSVVTHVTFGSTEEASIGFVNGQSETVPVSAIRKYVAESANPQNIKQVSTVTVRLPSLQRFRGLRFVDTPGLESVLSHNTEASLDWLPNVGLALIAIGVDPPLSQQDIELIRDVYQYTPHVTILLTKVDILTEGERQEVQSFIRNQLGRNIGRVAPIYPYSVRPGFEKLRRELEEKVFLHAISHFESHREDVIGRKVRTLVQECEDYVTMALKSAETLDSDREDLKRQIIGERETLDEFKTELRLMMRHSAAATRDNIEKRLQVHQTDIERRLQAELSALFPGWTKSLAMASEQFESWLSSALAGEMRRLSQIHVNDFTGRVDRLNRQLTRALQDFRNRLSDRVMSALGIPLRTSEIEMATAPPKNPDVKVFKIFDHNWEVFSWAIPMTLVRGWVRSHFERKIPDVVFKNVSRLTSQWEEAVNGAMLALEKQAEQRVDELISTIADLLSHVGEEAPQIRADLERLRSLKLRT